MAGFEYEVMKLPRNVRKWIRYVIHIGRAALTRADSPLIWFVQRTLLSLLECTASHERTSVFIVCNKTCCLVHLDLVTKLSDDM